jgi:metallo-beta-lactamase family protein
VKLTFLGAAGEVTGSCYLVESEALRFIVDCGLFQGGPDADAKNHAAFAFAPRELDFALLTHAHLDHCGLLPRLAAGGFGGPIYATPATVDLAEVMLRDAAHIQAREEDKPLYTGPDVNRVCALLGGHAYDAEFKPHPDVRVRFRDAGHILGAAIAEVWVREGSRTTKIVFSGDLGQPTRPLVRDPTPITEADVLLVESTYGNRNHRTMDETVDELVAAITETIVRGRGNVIVPAFALGRTQELIVMLGELTLAGRLGPLDVYVDSPLASAATQVTLKHVALLDDSARRVLHEATAGRLPMRLRFTEDVEDSKALNEIRSGAVIVAASGMCDAGRIRHHLERNLARPECAVLFTGFQAHGTTGRRIVDGARSVRLFGEDVPVRARVYTLGGLSAHADQRALLAWLGRFRGKPRACYAVHGEAESAAQFALVARERLRWDIHVPGPRSTVAL